MAAASWGDEAMDALRRMLAEVDAGKNVDEVFGDELQGIDDLSRRIGFGKKKKKPNWMTPEQEALTEQAAARQREYAANLRREQEMADIDEMLNAAAIEEMAKKDEAMRQLNRETWNALKPAIDDTAVTRKQTEEAVNRAMLEQAPDVVMPELRAQAANLLDKAKLMKRMRINDELSRLGRGLEDLDADELREIIRFLGQGQ